MGRVKRDYPGKPSTRALVAADLFAALPTLIWLCLFKAASDHYGALPAYGYSGAWDFWVYFPLVLSLGLLIAMSIFTFIVRRPGVLALIAGVALLPILPYVAMIGGGV